MFSERYQFFDMELVSWEIETNSNFRLERDAYSYLKTLSTTNGYRYIRIETEGQQGFPDILLLRKKEYLLIEAKRLNKTKLVKIEDDLKWQFGQIAFAVRSFRLDMEYVIAVCKYNNLVFIGQEPTICRMQERITLT